MANLVYLLFIAASGYGIHWALRRARLRQGYLEEPCFRCKGLLFHQATIETRQEIVEREDGRKGRILIVFGLPDFYECRRCHARYRLDTSMPGARRLVTVPKREPEIELRREALPAEE